VNVSKTYAVHSLPASLGTPPSMSTATPASGPLTIYNNPISIVPNFKNLGIEFSIEEGRWTPFLQRNLQSARTSAHYITMMCKLGIPLCPRTVKNLSQSLVYSVMEFGIQIWGPFCPPRNIVERDSFRLFVIRQSMRLHPYWKDCPRGPRIYPSSSLVLRLDWGISPVKHRIAELTFRYWNRVLTMSTASPLRRSFVQWFSYFTRASAPRVADDWFRAAGAIFATYGLSRFFLAMTPVPYGELSEAFINLWTKHEMDYADRPACNGRLLHYVPIIEALAAKASGYVHKLTSDERGSFSAKKRVITIYKLGMASYLSSWVSLHHGPNAVRIMTVIRSGCAPALCACCTDELPPAHALLHILVECCSLQLATLRQRLLCEIETNLPEPVSTRIRAKGLLCNVSFLLAHVEIDYELMTLLSPKDGEIVLSRLLRYLADFLRGIYLLQYYVRPV
jgi:hypothetical protein